MNVKLRRGKSKSSMLVVALSELHLFVFWPSLGTDSFGITIRWRWRWCWHHQRVILWQRNPIRWDRVRSDVRRTRPTRTIFEWSAWRTAPGTRPRVGTKSYLRLKAAAGA